MATIGVNVTYREYHDLGHWYSPQMLKDAIEFLRQKISWEE